MKIEKRDSGNYRVRLMKEGKNYSLSFDHKPIQAEIAMKLSEAIKRKSGVKDSFEDCAKSYINSKTNVLSPATIRGYYTILNNYISDSFKAMSLNDINQLHVQLLINDIAKDHSPKTTRNAHGFISSVLRTFIPDMILNTTLPQKLVHEPVCPLECDIKKILKASEGTMYHIPFQLGVLGMRRSEICALTVDDIEGNKIHITKAYVPDKDNNWVTKTTKTEAGTRDIYIPDELVNEIKERGVIFEGYPNSLYRALGRYCKQLGIQTIRFHDLRHFFASYAHSKGMSDADIMASGGWKSDYTMKNIYRHSRNETREAMQIEIARSFL